MPASGCKIAILVLALGAITAAHALPPEAVLGIFPGASTDEIKRAFREKALAAHPDQGGDAKAFQELRSAYEYLLRPTVSTPDLEQIRKIAAAYRRWVYRNQLDPQLAFFFYNFSSDGSNRSHTFYTQREDLLPSEDGWDLVDWYSTMWLNEVPFIRASQTAELITLLFAGGTYGEGLHRLAMNLKTSPIWQAFHQPVVDEQGRARSGTDEVFRRFLFPGSAGLRDHLVNYFSQSDNRRPLTPGMREALADHLEQALTAGPLSAPMRWRTLHLIRKLHHDSATPISPLWTDCARWLKRRSREAVYFTR